MRNLLNQSEKDQYLGERLGYAVDLRTAHILTPMLEGKIA